MPFLCLKIRRAARSILYTTPPPILLKLSVAVVLSSAFKMSKCLRSRQMLRPSVSIFVRLPLLKWKGRVGEFFLWGVASHISTQNSKIFIIFLKGACLSKAGRPCVLWQKINKTSFPALWKLHNRTKTVCKSALISKTLK